VSPSSARRASPPSPLLAVAVADAGADAGAVAESAANRTRFPAAACAASSARHDALVVEVFATETETRPRATLRVRVALRGGSPFLSHGHGLTSRAEGNGDPGSRASTRKVSFASAFSASRGSLRSTPVLVAMCATLAFFVVCARAVVRACLEGSEAREAPPPAPPRETSATIRNRA
jgi:hypothetical protein